MPSSHHLKKKLERNETARTQVTDSCFDPQLMAVRSLEIAITVFSPRKTIWRHISHCSLIICYNTIVSYSSEASSTCTKHSSCKNTWLDLSGAIWSSEFPFSFLCFSSKHFARCWHISAVDANLRWSWWVSSVSDRHRTSLVAWAFSRSAKLFWSLKISLSFSYGGWFIIFSISVFFSSSCWFNFCTS